MSEVSHKELISSLKEKRFNDMRKWVVQNLDKEALRSCLEVSMMYFINRCRQTLSTSNINNRRLSI